jgi:hypothetical protein
VTIWRRLKRLPFVRAGSGVTEVVGRTGDVAAAVLEERGHWGVSVSPSTQQCPRCGLPPTAEVLVFPCGHVFHAACLPEEACVRCMAHPAAALPTTWELRTLST